MAIADDHLPLLIMEMPDYSVSRAKQALCRVTKLLVKSGTLDGKEGIKKALDEHPS